MKKIRKTIDTAKNIGKALVIAGGTYVLTSCGGKINSRDIAYRALEKELSIDSGLVKEILGYTPVDIDGLRMTCKVLNDSTYSLDYCDGKVDTFNMKVETYDKGNKIYDFHLERGLPFFLRVEVSPDGKSEVTKKF